MAKKKAGKKKAAKRRSVKQIAGSLLATKLRRRHKKLQATVVEDMRPPKGGSKGTGK